MGARGRSREGFHRKRRQSELPVQPPSCVRVLHDEDELAEALDRAMAYERSGTELYQSRLVRYDEALRSARAVYLPVPEPTVSEELDALLGGATPDPN